MVDIHARLKHFYSQPEFFSNTIKAVIEGGNIRFKAPFSEESFETLESARSHIDKYGVTETYTYGRQGDRFSSRMLNFIAEQEPGYRIEQQVFNLQETAQQQRYHDIRQRGGQFFGLEAVDSDRARLLRIHEGDRELTSAEVDRVLRKYGLEYPGGTGKGAKRAKALLAEKAIEMVDESPIAVSVVSEIGARDMGVFRERERRRLWADDGERYLRDLKHGEGIVADNWSDIQNLMDEEGLDSAKVRALEYRVQEAIDKAQDGYMVVSRGLIDRNIQRLQGELGEVEMMLNSAYKQGDRVKLLQDQRKIRNALQSLTDAMDKGGVFNMRLTGFDMLLDENDPASQEIHDFISRLTSKGKGLQIKVNASISGDLGEGVDAKIYYKNISEGGGGLLEEAPVRGPGGRFRWRARGPSALTLDPFEPGRFGMEPGAGIHPTRLDVQTFASHFEMFDEQTMEVMSRDYLQSIRQELEGMKPLTVEEIAAGKRAEPPRAIIEMLESQLARLEGKDPQLYRQTQRMLERLEGGAVIANDPNLANRVVDILKMGVGRGGENDPFRIPNMVIPGSFRGEVVPAAEVGQQVAAGSIRYHPRLGWLMNRNDADEVYAAFGGFDFDDALNGMIRVDSNGQLKVIMSRQPNARGEIALFNLDQETFESRQILEYNFKRSGKTNSEVAQLLDRRAQVYDRIDELRDEIQTLSNDASMLFGKDREAVLADRSRLQGELNDLMNQIGEIKRELIDKTFMPMTDDVRGIGLIDDTTAEGMPARKGSHRYYVDEGGGVGRYWYKGERNIFDLFEGTTEARPGAIYETVESLSRPGAEREFRERVSRKMAEMDFTRGHETIQAMTKRVEDMLAVQDAISESPPRSAALGIYSNARMFMDHFLGANAKALRDSGMKLQDIILLEQETVIDAYVQSLKAMDVDVNEIAGRMQRSVVRGAIEARVRGVDVGIDRAFADLKLSTPGGIQSLFEEVRAEIQAGEVDEARLQRLAQLNFEDLFFEKGDPRAKLSRLREVADEAQNMLSEFQEKEVSMSEDIMGRRFGDRATRDAESLIRTYRRSVSESMDLPFVNYEQLADEISGVRVPGELAEEANAAVLRTLAGMSEVVEGQEVLGTRAMAAVARMGQMLQRAGGDFAEMRGLSDTGLIESTRRWASTKGEEWAPQTVRELSETYGRILTPDREVQDFLRRMLGEEEFDVMARLQAGIDLDDGIFSTTDMPEGVKKRLAESGMLQYNEAIFGPLDMRTYVTRGEDPVNIGEMILRMMQQEATTGTYDEASAEAIRTAFRGFRGAVEEAALDAGAPLTDNMREAYIRAMDDIGSDKADIARKAARDAVDVTSGRKGWGFLNDLKNVRVGNTNLGRVGMYAGIATVGAALVHQVSEGDVTKDDMQGPPNLPGGNPYQEMGGRQNMGVSPGPAPMSNIGGGVTYEVRTRGGDPSNIYDELSNIIGGGEVTGTTYDIEEIRPGFTPAGFSEGVFR